MSYVLTCTLGLKIFKVYAIYILDSSYMCWANWFPQEVAYYKPHKTAVIIIYEYIAVCSLNVWAFIITIYMLFVIHVHFFMYLFVINYYKTFVVVIQRYILINIGCCLRHVLWSDIFGFKTCFSRTSIPCFRKSKKKNHTGSISNINSTNKNMFRLLLFFIN